MGTFSVNNVDFGTSTSASCTTFNQETLAASPSGLTYGVAQSGQVITITSGTGAIPANRCVQIKIGSNATFGGAGATQITNPSTQNFYTTLIGGTFGDTGSITTHIILDDTVSLTGTVSQSLTFSISTSTLYFGILSSGAAKYASSTNTVGDTIENIAHTLSVSTNAPSGFSLTVKGQTLTSQQNTSNTITAIGTTAASSTPGSEQFGIRATETGGVGTVINTLYSYPDSYSYGATATSSSLFASGSGSTPTSVYSLRYLTNIGPITEAGTYAANLTYVATANF